MTTNTKLMVELSLCEEQALHDAQATWHRISEVLDTFGYLTDEYEELFDSMDEKFSELCDLLDNGFERSEEEEEDSKCTWSDTTIPGPRFA